MIDNEAEIAALQGLPKRILRTAQAILVDKKEVKAVADEQGIDVRTVYHRLRMVERCAGRDIPRHSRRGRPRKAAA